MNFLNPSLLFGLFAVSIPILIHLLNLRKIRKIEFSTLMFLKEIQKSKMRRIKLKQLILLALRVMAVIFLVLCFANPVYEGYAGGNDLASSRTVLIYIDDSFSMAARDNKGQYFNQSKDAVKKILETHSESDILYMIPASKIDLKDTKILYESFKELNDSLDRLEISDKPASMNEIINSSKKILAGTSNPKKEVFIISDFQKINMDQINDQTADVSNSSGQMNTYLIKIGDRSVNNLSLDSLIVLSKIIEKDKDVRVKIFLRNNSQYNVYNKSVNLYIDNELKGERSVDVNSSDKKEIDFSFKPSHPGNIKGIIEIVQSEFQDDEILQDNKYYFTLYIPESFRIGIISGSPRDKYFIELALNTAGSILSDSIKRKSSLFSIYSLNTIDENISRYNVVFLSGKQSFTDTESGVLKDYVSNGGGLFIFPGAAADINNYNNTLLSKLNFVKIEHLNSGIDENKNLKFEKVDFENPVLSEIFSNQKLSSTSEYFNIESPLIRSYFRLLPNENADHIITLSNNIPFLVEAEISKGKVIFSSVSATEDQSDLPFKSIFVPLIVRSIYYLGNNFEFQKVFTVGRSNLIPVRGLNNITEMILPDGSVYQSGNELQSPADNFLYLPYSKFTAYKGLYSLKDSSGSVSDFALNNDPDESNLVYSDEEELADYFNKNGITNVKLIEKPEEISAAVSESSKGLSLWKYFLFAALMFIAAELWYSKRLEKSS